MKLYHDLQLVNEESDQSDTFTKKVSLYGTDPSDLTKKRITISEENGRVGIDVSAVAINQDRATHDSFGRMRVSNPETILDIKQTIDNAPLFYDDKEVSGTGTSSTYQEHKASTRLAVSANTAGVRVKQSKLWGNYQPGKSQLIFITFANLESATGIKKMAGYYNDKWGIYTKHEDGVANVGIRTFNTGSAVDIDVAQADWNLDKMDGTGTSGVTLDFTQTQIFVIDFEWLGVGRVRTGWVIDGAIYYCHHFLHTNNTTEVYMSNPNAPIRYEIANDGTGGADTLDTICASIQSEGGQEATNITTYVSRDGTPITLAAEDLFTPIVSVRLKSNAVCTRVNALEVHALITTSNINYEWAIFINPTVAGTDQANWTDVTNSALQYDITRNNTNTISGGIKIAGGYGASTATAKLPIDGTAKSFFTIGSLIDGTSEEMVLAIKNIDGNGGVAYGGLTLSEYC